MTAVGVRAKNCCCCSLRVTIAQHHRCLLLSPPHLDPNFLAAEAPGFDLGDEGRVVRSGGIQDDKGGANKISYWIGCGV